jgi:hypothetical protein
MTTAYRLKDIEREHPRPWQFAFNLTENGASFDDMWIEDANGFVVFKAFDMLHCEGEQKTLKLLPLIVDAVNAYEGDRYCAQCRTRPAIADGLCERCDEDEG